MKLNIKYWIFISYAIFIVSYLIGQDLKWNVLDNGLCIGEFESSQKSIMADSKITVIKINPNFFTFKLLCANELKHSSLTAKEWCQKYNLIGAINAGMFQTDHRSNVGYMKNYNYVNNPTINLKYLSVAAFNPIDSTSNTYFHIFDIDNYDMNDIINNFNTVIQNLRLIKRPSLNRWSQQHKKWSEAILGQDKKGNVLFIFSRSPYSMHDLIDILKGLPIDIDCAQHLEGGPEASLYFSYKNCKIEKFGSYETDFSENDNNNSYWPIPNIIGFQKNK